MTEHILVAFAKAQSEAKYPTSASKHVLIAIQRNAEIAATKTKETASIIA